MNLPMKNFLLIAVLAGSTMLLSACIGYVDGGPDYYGPRYGGPVYYGHPYYQGSIFIGGGGRRWR